MAKSLGIGVLLASLHAAAVTTKQERLIPPRLTSGAVLPELSRRIDVSNRVGKTKAGPGPPPALHPALRVWEMSGRHCAAASALAPVSEVSPARRRPARTRAALSGSHRYTRCRGAPLPCDRLGFRGMDPKSRDGASAASGVHRTPRGPPFRREDRTSDTGPSGQMSEACLRGRLLRLYPTTAVNARQVRDAFHSTMQPVCPCLTACCDLSSSVGRVMHCARCATVLAGGFDAVSFVCAPSSL